MFHASPNGDSTTDTLLTEKDVKVYPQRWIQLAYLSILALMSDWICFSVAAAPDTYQNSFGHSAASLIDMFLFMNVASCFVVTDVVDKFGMKNSIRGAAALMAAGCWLRSGISFFGNVDLVPYPLLVVGTLMVGAAQPFFQCTPPLLSAQWFASSERATSTAVALNFNQIGIATAFLVGGAMATTTSGLEHYFGLISVLCTILLAGTVLQFENLPPTPPSVSELDKLGDKAVPFIESVQKFFSTPGFTLPLAAFICSISITNVVGAFIDEIMERGGIANQLGIDLAGAGFELAILLGGIVIGGFVDRTKEYKKVTLACLAATFGILLPLGLTNEHLGNEPILLVAALLGLGIACGPVQPINAELAVDVTYPGDETAVESVQQIGGNLVSALLVPLADMATRQDWKLFSQNDVLSSDIRGDVLLLMAISAITFVYFSGFNAPLLRTMADTESVNEEPIITNGAPVIDVSSSSKEELQNVNK
jgi:FLVCR family feline leukemia virus subgroup C receptor-related protein